MFTLSIKRAILVPIKDKGVHKKVEANRNLTGERPNKRIAGGGMNSK